MSLYLGEGMVDLPEVEEEMISSDEQEDTLEQSMVSTLKVSQTRNNWFMPENKLYICQLL